MEKSDILEELYNRLPNREADNLINMILDGDPEGISRAENFLRGKPESRLSYNLFQSILEKPICKTVAKFMDGNLLDTVSVCKMLSSILTQIFIQCELRDISLGEFDIQRITGLLDTVSQAAGNLDTDSDLYLDVQSAIRDLGWEDSNLFRSKEGL